MNIKVYYLLIYTHTHTHLSICHPHTRATQFTCQSVRVRIARARELTAGSASDLADEPCDERARRRLHARRLRLPRPREIDDGVRFLTEKLFPSVINQNEVTVHCARETRPLGKNARKDAVLRESADYLSILVNFAEFIDR